MADVTISQEQYDKWQDLAEKARYVDAQKMAKRRATAIVVKAHMTEYQAAYGEVMKELLA